MLICAFKRIFWRRSRFKVAFPKDDTLSGIKTVNSGIWIKEKMYEREFNFLRMLIKEAKQYDNKITLTTVISDMKWREDTKTVTTVMCLEKYNFIYVYIFILLAMFIFRHKHIGKRVRDFWEMSSSLSWGREIPSDVFGNRKEKKKTNRCSHNNNMCCSAACFFRSSETRGRLPVFIQSEMKIDYWVHGALRCLPTRRDVYIC